MTPERINAAREWLASHLMAPIPLEISDTIDEALELAMERALTEAKDAASRAEWEALR